LASYLLQGQQHELLCLGHVHEVLQHIPVCCLEQVTARVCVCKASDAQTVGGVKLAQQELAAGIPDTIQLQEAGSREQSLWAQKCDDIEGAGKHRVTWDQEEVCGG
jgi:hypothetical protein